MDAIKLKKLPMKAIKISGEVSFDFTTVLRLTEKEWQLLQDQKERWIYLGENNPVIPHLLKVLHKGHLKSVTIDYANEMTS